MKLVILKVQSFNDIITNSSSVLFIVKSDKAQEALNEITSNMNEPDFIQFDYSKYVRVMKSNPNIGRISFDNIKGDDKLTFEEYSLYTELDSSYIDLETRSIYYLEKLSNWLINPVDYKKYELVYPGTTLEHKCYEELTPLPKISILLRKSIEEFKEVDETTLNGVDKELQADLKTNLYHWRLPYSNFFKNFIDKYKDLIPDIELIMSPESRKYVKDLDGLWLNIIEDRFEDTIQKLSDTFGEENIQTLSLS